MSETQRRWARVRRATEETDVEAELYLDAGAAPGGDRGAGVVETGVPFFDHLLRSMARHGRMELTLRARGDLAAGAHHTVEDAGLTLGEAIRTALHGSQRVANGCVAPGVARFGHAVVPMDEALVLTAVDLSGRPHCALAGLMESPEAEGFPPALWVAFCRGLAASATITLHQRVLAGEDGHHVLEAAAKSLGLALLAAWQPLTAPVAGAAAGDPTAAGDPRSLKGAVRLEVQC